MARLPVKIIPLALLACSLFALGNLYLSSLTGIKDAALEQSEIQNNALRVATFNLWNYMFHWQIRKLHIASLLQKYDPAIVGLQEVRSRDHDWKDNQLLDLRHLVSDQYQYQMHAMATTVSGGEGSDEGVGLLSKFPILATQRFRFQRQQSDPDLNQRVALWALLDTSSQLSEVKYSRLNVIVTHFSYERSTQCNNLLELMKAIHHDIPSAASGYPFVILGDFNAYNDSSAPLDLIIDDGQPPPLVHRCDEAMLRERVTRDDLRKYKWLDAWKEANQDASETSGYTFSTMPWPGLVCRPDRILVSGLSVDNVVIDKSSKAYKREYFWKINFSRLEIAGYNVQLIIFQIVLIVITILFSVVLCLISRAGRALATIILFILIVTLLIFSSRIWSIWAVALHPQQEDYNPSDHLMLVADLSPE